MKIIKQYGDFQLRKTKRIRATEDEYYLEIVYYFNTYRCYTILLWEYNAAYGDYGVKFIGDRPTTSAKTKKQTKQLWKLIKFGQENMSNLLNKGSD